MERLTKRIGNFIAYSDFNDNDCILEKTTKDIERIAEKMRGVE